MSALQISHLPALTATGGSSLKSLSVYPSIHPSNHVYLSLLPIYHLSIYLIYLIYNFPVQLATIYLASYLHIFYQSTSLSIYHLSTFTYLIYHLLVYIAII